MLIIVILISLSDHSNICVVSESGADDCFVSSECGWWCFFVCVFFWLHHFLLGDRLSVVGEIKGPHTNPDELRGVLRGDLANSDLTFLQRMV